MKGIAAAIIVALLCACHPTNGAAAGNTELEATTPMGVAIPSKAAEAGQDGQALLHIAEQHKAAGNLAAAEDALAKALLAATNANDNKTLVDVLLQQTQLFAIDGKDVDARNAIGRAREVSARLDDPLLRTRVATAAIALTARGITSNDLAARLNEGLKAASGIQDSALRARLTNDLIESTVDAFRVTGNNADVAAQLQERAEAIRTQSARSGWPREAARASHELANLYLLAHQYQDAIASSRAAILDAQQAGDDEVLYKALETLARTEQSSGHPLDAVRDLRLAVDAFERVRDNVARAYLIDASAFRDHVGEVYLALVDGLLASAGQASGSDAQPLRREAIAAMEAFRTTELRSYLLNSCVEQPKRSVEQILASLDAHQAVLYPIVLTDRLEVLLLANGAISQHSIPLSSRAVESEFKLARQALETRSSDAYRDGSRKIYAMLADPFKSELSGKVDTLIYVPDSWLRLIPLAALWDGESFVIERYAVITAPYLSEESLSPSGRSGTRTFAGGISEAVQGYPALPGVARELDSVTHEFGPQGLVSLRDGQFTSAAFRQSLQSDQFRVIHLATHGEFTARSNESYLITYDNRIALSDLDASLGHQLANGGTDLMVLSACQTAAGDDRSALGLAGIALKAGARDTLATLWYVSDAAAARLIATFYQSLATSSSPAQALRHAQIELIKSERFSHPDFWSPFIMIGGIENPGRKKDTSNFATTH